MSTSGTPTPPIRVSRHCSSNQRPFVAARHEPQSAGILAVARRLRQYRWAQWRHAEPVRLEGADVPPRHPGQRQPSLAVRGGDRVVVELVRSQCHAATLAREESA